MNKIEKFLVYVVVPVACIIILGLCGYASTLFVKKVFNTEKVNQEQTIAIREIIAWNRGYEAGSADCETLQAIMVPRKNYIVPMTERTIHIIPLEK